MCVRVCWGGDEASTAQLRLWCGGVAWAPLERSWACGRGDVMMAGMVLISLFV